MGVVYRARDEHLERDVAIKLLPMGLLAEAEARKQFRGEALILSRLNHPNIGMVFEFGSQDGIDFLVLELVPGEPLSSRIARGALPEQEIGALGEQLARGLAAAHRNGVLHRDIKPANLRLTPDGTLKILDFGLARVTLPVTELTRTKTISAGVGVAGTIPYMSPEQLRRQTLDARSDIHAAGAVLYEMACGRRAFPQEDAAAVIAAILGERPTPPSASSPGVSKDLEDIVARCLEKDPKKRYQTAEELSSDLHQLASPPNQRHLAAGRGKRGRRRVRAAGFALAALATAAALLFGLNVGGLRDRYAPPLRTETPSLAVLPLGNVSGDHAQDYFADGITDELITRLAQIPTLKVISRSSAMQYRDSKKAAPQIARELGVKMLVQGTVQRAGDRVRIHAQLVDATKDRNLWGDTFEGSAR